MCALQKTLIVALMASLLGGCAAPIISHDRAQEAGRDSAEPMEGFTYYLAKSTPTAVFRVRLENCQTPTVTVLAPEVTANPKADRGARFRVSPADAFNLFRSIESKITLTPDGRLGTAFARSEDKTIAVLTQFIKDAATARQAFGAFSLTTPDSKAAPPPSPCTEEADLLVKQRNSALQALQSATQNESDFLAASASFKKGVSESQKTFVDALTRLAAKVEELNSKLTKSVSIRLDVAPGQPSLVKDDYIDITHGWFAPSMGGGCAVVKVGDKDVVVADDNCLRFSASMSAPSGDAAAGGASKASATTSGVWYRQPVNVSLETRVGRDKRAGSQSRSVLVELDTERALSAALPSITNLTTGERVLASSPVKVPQWGTLSRLPMDVGLLATNEVRVEFDEWSVPKSVEWKVAPSTIPGLLGLVPQASAAFAKPTTDPTAALRGDLLTQLLQACIAALASGAAVPSYCSSILR